MPQSGRARCTASLARCPRECSSRNFTQNSNAQLARQVTSKCGRFPHELIVLSASSTPAGDRQAGVDLVPSFE